MTEKNQTKYLIFDTETTGLPRKWNIPPEQDPDNWPHLVQLAWITYDQLGNRQKTRNHIIKPEGYTIPEKATKIHRITTQRANQEGKPLTQVLQEFSEDTRKTPTLIAHNISFDQQILAAEHIRTKTKNPLTQKTLICTMKHSTNYCQIPHRRGYKYPTLTELHHKLYGYGYQETHDALADTEACAKCFFELQRKKII